MMAEYQRKRGNKYILPTATYNATIWIIRDYYRMKEDAANILVSSPEDDGQPKGGGTGDPVFSKAAQREELIRRITVIEGERDKIPEVYREGVWQNVLYRSGYPTSTVPADRTTFARHKSRFVYGVAKKLKMI